MTDMDLWVARANIAALRRRLAGAAFTGDRAELLRQLAEQEERRDRLDGPAKRP